MEHIVFKLFDEDQRLLERLKQIYDIVIVAVAFLIYRGNALETIIPILTAMATVALRLLPSVNRVSGGLAAVAYSEPMLEKLIENLKDISGLDQVFLSGDGIHEIKERKDADIRSFHHEIRFDRITFCYPRAEADVLSDASMTIHCGESIGIVGNSGSGKATAVDILLGLLKP